jgi:hypothetical protein
MKKHTKIAMIFAGMAIAVPQGVFAKGPDAKLWNGTWHLNVAKSKFESANKEQSETRTYEVTADRITMKSSSKNAAGKPMNFDYSATLDGKWAPMHGNPAADSISLTSVSDRELKATARLHGKTTTHSTASVSADGKHLTLTRKNVGTRGAPTDVLEFDR